MRRPCAPVWKCHPRPLHRWGLAAGYAGVPPRKLYRLLPQTPFTRAFTPRLTKVGQAPSPDWKAGAWEKSETRKCVGLWPNILHSLLSASRHLGKLWKLQIPRPCPASPRLQAGMRVEFCCLHGFVIVFQINLLGWYNKRWASLWHFYTWVSLYFYFIHPFPTLSFPQPPLPPL